MTRGCGFRRLPLPDGGPAYSGHSQDIGVDFALRFGFAQNNSKNIAGCDTRASHPAIVELGKVQQDNFAPCDSLTSHPATSRYHTLPLSPIAQCDAKGRFEGRKTALPAPFSAGGAAASQNPTSAPLSACGGLSLRRLHILPGMSRTSPFQRPLLEFVPT